MFTSGELHALREAIMSAQATRDPNTAEAAATTIGEAVWGFAHDGYFHKGKFAARGNKPELAKVSRDAADKIFAAQAALDSLVEIKTKIGFDDAAARLQGVLGELFGDSASERDVRNAQFGNIVIGRFHELRDEIREIEIEPYCWPYRVREKARGAVLPVHCVSQVLTDIAHDLEVLGTFLEAYADANENKHGRQTTPAPMMFAKCIVAWLDATGVMPSASRPSETTKAAPLFTEIEKLLGSEEREGTSWTTYNEVRKVLSDKDAFQTFRFQFRIKLPNRKHSQGLE